MPTPAQLNAEVWYVREYMPASVVELCERLRARYGVGPIAIGSKGDENHVYGYHRSRAWILHSIWCTDRTYSVTETEGNRSGGDEDWLCAIDITIPLADLMPMCQRLDDAVRAGRLEKITEWYGNADGDTRVDGYDNIRNVLASSDDSHLWHLHISLDRGRAGEPHDDLFAILTGDDMAHEEWSAEAEGAALADGSTRPTWALTQGPDGFAGQQRDTALAFAWANASWAFATSQEILARLNSPQRVEVDADAVAAALAGNEEFLAAIANRVLSGIRLVQGTERGQ